MKQTSNILKQLETQYYNIEYYHTIVKEIEDNVEINPDIAIESCKSLFEGIGKFIISNIDKSLKVEAINNFKYIRAVEKAIDLLKKKDPVFELDFSKGLLEALKELGEIRNDRGDISHGRLAPKAIQSDSHFSNLILTMTDSFASYLLISFSRVPYTRELEYEDSGDFNLWLDNVYTVEIEDLTAYKKQEKQSTYLNEVRLLSYSKALFDQDQVSYEQALQNYLDTKETENING